MSRIVLLSRDLQTETNLGKIRSGIDPRKREDHSDDSVEVLN
jgi:hypothetical protein